MRIDSYSLLRIVLHDVLIDFVGSQAGTVLIVAEEPDARSAVVVIIGDGDVISTRSNDASIVTITTFDTAAMSSSRSRGCC